MLKTYTTLPILTEESLLFACALVFLLAGDVANAEPTANERFVNQLQSQIEDQATEIASLKERIDQQDVFVDSPLRASIQNLGTGLSVRKMSIVAEDALEPTDTTRPGQESITAPRFLSDYDRGFIIRPTKPDKLPFEIRTNGWIQFRHHGFTRDVVSWTDNAGVTRAVRNRNAFDIERGRLAFSGHVLDEQLTYFLQLDGDTDGRHTVDFFDYWWAWDFGDRLKVQMGKRKVPAGRQWLLGARRTRFVDRPMANDFFRPDRTVGLFAVGKIFETGHYELMAGNGYRTANIPNSGTDDRLTFAFTNYFDPLGRFGNQLVDFDCSCDPLVRFGHSMVYSPVDSNAIGTPLDEADFVRLSDGTILDQTGALAPGVTVSNFDIYFYGVDFAVKYRGWSLNSEIFFRWIKEIQGDGALPLNDIYQKGYYVEGGRFLYMKTLDINFRYSQVDGEFGTASEYAIGTNWYPLETSKMKFSFDVTVLDGSPLQNTTSDILVGDDGTLFRTQFQAEF